MGSVAHVDTREVLTRPAEPPDAVVRYGDHDDALIDVYLPPALGRPEEPRRLLVLVHGGFWRQDWDRVHVRPLADALRHRGFVVALPEYRRVGGRGGWPQTGFDVEAAVGAAPTLLAEVVPGHIDATAPLTMSGHSAGGHLALWAGLRAGPSRVDRIVALAPVADVHYAAAAKMGDGAVQALLGGEPDEQPEHYAEADVVRLLPGHADVTVIHGSQDEHVDVEMNRRLGQRYSGPTLSFTELPGTGHFELIDPLAAAFESSVLPACTGRSPRG